MSLVKNLLGKTFGRLHVIQRAENTSQGQARWVCQCSCPDHTITVVTGTMLTNGQIKSCGCLKRETTSKIFAKDLTGMRFGRLVAIEPTNERSGGSIVWRCKCDCGGESMSSSNNLLSGRSQSCGCLQRERTSSASLNDLTGQTFGRLTVLHLLPNRTADNHTLYECKCECGNTCVVCGKQLRNGDTKSCGCLRSETSTKHGESMRIWSKDEEPIIDRYRGMKNRCYNPNDSNYKNYGGRGITICDEWLRDPNAFVQWAKKTGFKEDLWIERIDNNGPYAPWNCRWATRLEQANNKRTNVMVDINGTRHSVADWARLAGIEYPVALYSLHKDYCLFKDIILANLNKS